MEGVVIADTSCLIVLQQIGQIDLLKAIYGKVIITPTVAIECEAPLPAWIEIQAPKSAHSQGLWVLLQSLNAGMLFPLPALFSSKSGKPVFGFPINF